MSVEKENDGSKQQQKFTVLLPFSFVLVMHPNVEDDIDADLDIMRLSVRLLESLPFDVFRNIKWLNLPGVIDEMDTMLNIQLDLRTEAHHLVTFNENFKDNDSVVFPKVREGRCRRAICTHQKRPASAYPHIHRCS